MPDKIYTLDSVRPEYVIWLGFFMILLSSTASEPTTLAYLAMACGFFLILGSFFLIYRGAALVRSAESLSEVGTSDIQQAVRQLSKNYDLDRRQAHIAFMLAALLMTLGVMVIISGAAGDLLGFAKARSNLTVLAGIVIDSVSGVGMFLFNQRSKQVSSVSRELQEMWRLLAAFEMTRELPEEARTEARKSLIERLASPARDDG